MVELLVGDLRHLAVVGLEDDRGLVGLRLQVPVEAVVGGVQLAVVEPPVERRLRFVERLGEGLLPGEIFPREPRPEAFEVALGLVAQGLIRRHARDVRLLDEIRRRRKQAVFLEHRFDGSGGHCESLLVVYGTRESVYRGRFPPQRSSEACENRRLGLKFHFRPHPPFMAADQTGRPRPKRRRRAAVHQLLPSARLRPAPGARLRARAVARGERRHRADPHQLAHVRRRPPPDLPGHGHRQRVPQNRHGSEAREASKAPSRTPSTKAFAAPT